MGLFVVFEGVEGSGKSTQSRALKGRLARSGIAVTLVHEPGGTPTGERIGQWLKRDHGITPMAELFLFSAARTVVVETVIRPALSQGKVVVCDRYVYSTVAYQGYGRGLELDAVAQLNELATGGLLPQLVFLLDFPPENGFGRKSGKPLDRIEREQREFHTRVRKGYLEIAAGEPDRWRVIDATKPVEEIGDIVWGHVQEKLSQHKRAQPAPPPLEPPAQGTYS